MKCPSCAVETADASEECQACGVNFAKWRAKLEKAADGPPPEHLTKPPVQVTGSHLGAVVIVLVLFGAVAAAYGVYKKSAEPVAVQDNAKVFDPTAYKAQISALEMTLYKDTPPTPAEANAISNIGLQLAGVINEEHAKNPFVKEAVSDLMLYAGQVSSSGDDPKALSKARPDWIGGWETVREKRFDHAPWLHAAQDKK